MIIRNSLVTACLLTLASGVTRAEDPKPLAPELVQQLTRGKKLDLVWSAPGFDATKGFRMGAIANGTGSDIKTFLFFFPIAFQHMVRPDSPYTLQLTLASLQARGANSDRPSARLRLEGRFVDPEGNTVAAFSTSAASMDGPGLDQCERNIVGTIQAALAKDLFPRMPRTDAKSPSIIVPAPSVAAPVPTPEAVPTPVSVPLPEPVASEPAAAPAEPGPAAEPAAAPAPPATVAPPAKLAPAPVAPANPDAVPPAPKAPSIPVAAAPALHSGKALTKVWISPAFDRSAGFSLGEVRYQIEAHNDVIDQYLPGALAAICRTDAPCSLRLRIAELQVRTQAQSLTVARVGVEGSLVAKDGTLLAAFSTVGISGAAVDQNDMVRVACQKVVQAIAKEFQ